MDRIFKYCTLHYVHSQLLAERLNVGILFYFPGQGQLIFRSLARVKKLKSLYPSFPFEVVSHYLRELERGAKEIGAFCEAGLEEDLNDLIQKSFLTPESAPFQFSVVKSAYQYTSTIDKIVFDYCSLYERDSLKSPQDNTLTEAAKESPVRKFKEYLTKIYPNVSELFLPVHTIRNRKAIFKPNLIWKNGSTNLVTEVNFPKTETALIDRALLLNRKTDYLIDEAKANNYRFDFLIQKPVDPKLLGPYENAIEILEDIKAPKEIVTERKLEGYFKKAAIDLKDEFETL